MPSQVVLQHDGGTDLVNQRLVLSRLLAESAIDHGLMSQNGGEPLVHIFHGNVRHLFSPSVHELLHPLQVLTRQSVGLQRSADNDPLHLLT